MVLVDADKPPTPATVATFVAAGGVAVSWGTGRALEDELFLSLDDGAIHALLQRAVELVGDELVDSHIRSQFQGSKTLDSVMTEGIMEGYSVETRRQLGITSRKGKNSWFKSVSKCEGVAKDIVGPNLATADPAFMAMVDQLFRWTHAA